MGGVALATMIGEVAKMMSNKLDDVDDGSIAMDSPSMDFWMTSGDSDDVDVGLQISNAEIAKVDGSEG